MNEVDYEEFLINVWEDEALAAEMASDESKESEEQTD